jgi:hypothetical protein
MARGETAGPMSPKQQSVRHSLSANINIEGAKAAHLLRGLFGGKSKGRGLHRGLRRKTR